MNRLGENSRRNDIIIRMLIDTLESYHRYLVSNSSKNHDNIFKQDFMNHPILKKYICQNRLNSIWEIISYYINSSVISNLRNNSYPITTHHEGFLLSSEDTCTCQKNNYCCQSSTDDDRSVKRPRFVDTGTRSTSSSDTELSI